MSWSNSDCFLRFLASLVRDTGTQNTLSTVALLLETAQRYEALAPNSTTFNQTSKQLKDILQEIARCLVETILFLAIIVVVVSVIFVVLFLLALFHPSSPSNTHLPLGLGFAFLSFLMMIWYYFSYRVSNILARLRAQTEPLLNNLRVEVDQFVRAEYTALNSALCEA